MAEVRDVTTGRRGMCGSSTGGYGGVLGSPHYQADVVGLDLALSFRFHFNYTMYSSRERSLTHEVI